MKRLLSIVLAATVAVNLLADPQVMAKESDPAIAESSESEAEEPKLEKPKEQEPEAQEPKAAESKDKEAEGEKTLTEEDSVQKKDISAEKKETLKQSIATQSTEGLTSESENLTAGWTVEGVTDGKVKVGGEITATVTIPVCSEAVANAQVNVKFDSNVLLATSITASGGLENLDFTTTSAEEANNGKPGETDNIHKYGTEFHKSIDVKMESPIVLTAKFTVKDDAKLNKYEKLLQVSACYYATEADRAIPVDYTNAYTDVTVETGKTDITDTMTVNVPDQYMPLDNAWPPTVPNVTVTYDGNELTKGVDYTVSGAGSWTNNGGWPYVGGQEGTVKISPVEDSKYTFEEKTVNFTALRNENKLTISWKDENNTLDKRADGKPVSIENASNQPWGTSYGGTLDPFKLIKADLTSCSEKGNPNGKGGNIYPASVIWTYYSDESCENEVGSITGNGSTKTGTIPTDAGKYWVKLSVPASNYFDAAESNALSFEIIDPNGDSDAIATATGTYTYTGQTIIPDCEVTLNGKTLAKDDYKLILPENCVNAGDNASYMVVSTKNSGDDGYFAPVKVTFSIQKLDLSKADNVTASLETEYTGKEAGQPDIMVNGIELPASELAVTKADSTTCINAGDYTVNYSVKAKDGSQNVTGSTNVTATITIKPADLDGLDEDSWEVTVKDKEETTIKKNAKYFHISSDADLDNLIGSVQVTAGELNLAKDDFEVIYNQTSTDTGVYKITLTIKPKTNQNYKWTSDIFIPESTFYFTSYTVTPVIDTDNLIYDGTEKKPEIKLLYGSESDTISSSRTVTYTNNIDAGTATVTVTGTGTKSFGTVTSTFEIAKRNISGDDTIAEVENQVYTGFALTPTVTLKAGENVIPESEYTVTYENNTDVGTAKAIIKAKGSNCTGQKEVTFQIVGDDNNIANMTVENIAAPTYNGKALAPDVTVKDKNGNTLKRDTDYTVEYENNINAGPEAKAVIAGIGSYAGKKEVTFTINPKSIDTVTASIFAQTYSGEALTPAVTVRDGSTTLKKDTDYTVTKYENNINAGTDAKAVITGKGNYTGEKTITFTINAKYLFGATIAAIADKTYNGQPQEPTLTVTDGQKELKAETDYTISYANNTNVGTASVTVTGKGNYKGSRSVTFKITAKDIADQTVTVDPIADQTYNGQEQKPDVTVKDGSTTLTKDTDYTVEYKDNITAGTATVTLTGKGNYQGTVSKTFKIAAKDIAGVTVDSITDQTYTGEALTPDVTVKDGSTPLTKDTDYIVEYQDNTNAGENTAKAVITGIGNYTGTKTVNFTIAPKSIADVTIAGIADRTYNGQAQEQTLTVTDGQKNLSNGTDYTISYEDNTNAGTAKVILTGKGNYTGTVEKTFTINKATLGDAFKDKVTGYTGTYDTKAHDAATTTLSADYTVSYSTSENGTYNTTAPQVKDVADSKTIYVKVEHENYEPLTFTVEAKITAMEVKGSMTDVTLPKLTYTGSEQTQAVSEVKVNGTALAASVYTVSGNKAKDAGTYTMTITFQGNYSGSVTADYEIAKAAATDEMKKLEVSAATGTHGEVDLKLPAEASLRANVTATNNGLLDKWEVKDGKLTYRLKSGTDLVGKTDTLTIPLTTKNYEDYELTVTITGEAPKIIEGAHGEWKKGSSNVLKFRSNADISDFVKVQVDSVDVDPSNYTVREGSTIVELKASYVEGLSTGRHTLAIVSADGTASTDFTVLAKDSTPSGSSSSSHKHKGSSSSSSSASSSAGSAQASSSASSVNAPKTGDDAPILLYMMLILAAAMCAGGIVVRMRRREER